MRANKTRVPSLSAAVRRRRFRHRQCTAAALSLALLAACAGDGRSPGDSPSFRGGLAGDEPRAVAVARDVLAQGGSAADAAVALFFALAVTKPSAASLGAGGACLAYDPSGKTVRALDFLPEPGAGHEPAPPTAVRGMAALHAMHGRLRWSQLVAPAETLARFGHQVSRSFAADLASASEIVRADPAATAVFGRPGGGIAQEGDTVVQEDLSAVLSAIRARGAGVLYEGPLARAYAERAGGLDLGDIAAFTPEAEDAVVQRIGSTRLAFHPSAATQGPFQLRLWTALTRRDRYEDARASERPAILADAAREARGGVPEATAGGAASGTGFAIVDRRGAGVTCGITMGRPFGTGRMAPGTGIFPAARPVSGEPAEAVSPLLAMNPNTNILIFAAGGSGQGAAVAATDVAVRTLLIGEPLGEAVAAPRPSEASLVNALHCVRGMPHRPETCTVRTDRRGYGLDAALAE